MTTYFKRNVDQPSHLLGTSDERCANCCHPFNDHYNGKCPCEECGTHHGKDQCLAQQKERGTRS